VAAIGLFFGLPLARALRAHAPPALPVLGTVPEFALTAQDGRSFGSAELRGKTWVAGFIFTRCTTVCPFLVEKMGKLQHRARNLGDAFHLVALSVDPEYDTPERLAEFAKGHRVSPRLWSFLTGPYTDIQRLVEGGMKVSVERSGSDSSFQNISHGSHLVLVDGAMRVRGYYDVATDEGFERLVRDIGLVVARGE
jgi:protein SCO1/2